MITVPDFFALLAAHKRVHGRPEPKGQGGRRFTPSEVQGLREAMSRADGEETAWRES